MTPSGFLINTEKWALIHTIRRFPSCKHSSHGRSSAANVTSRRMDLGGDAYSHLSLIHNWPKPRSQPPELTGQDSRLRICSPLYLRDRHDHQLPKLRGCDINLSLVAKEGIRRGWWRRGGSREPRERSHGSWAAGIVLWVPGVCISGFSPWGYLTLELRESPPFPFVPMSPLPPFLYWS